MGYYTTEINFLDVAATKVGKKLETDLYCEAIDFHHYLHAQSCHRNVYCILHTDRLRRLKEFIQQKKSLITVLSN